MQSHERRGARPGARDESVRSSDQELACVLRSVQ